MINITWPKSLTVNFKDGWHDLEMETPADKVVVDMEWAWWANKFTCQDRSQPRTEAQHMNCVALFPGGWFAATDGVRLAFCRVEREVAAPYLLRLTPGLPRKGAVALDPTNFVAGNFYNLGVFTEDVGVEPWSGYALDPAMLADWAGPKPPKVKGCKAPALAVQLVGSERTKYVYVRHTYWDIFGLQMTCVENRKARPFVPRFEFVEDTKEAPDAGGDDKSRDV